MSGQSRRGSAAEALFNVLVGYCINMLANCLIFPLFGWHISLEQNLVLGVFYTAISLLRSYCLRRFFNRMSVTVDGPPDDSVEMVMLRRGIDIAHQMAAEDRAIKAGLEHVIEQQAVEIKRLRGGTSGASRYPASAST